MFKYQEFGYIIKILKLEIPEKTTEKDKQKTPEIPGVFIYHLLILRTHLSLHLRYYFFSNIVWCRCIVAELHSRSCTAG